MSRNCSRVMSPRPGSSTLMTSAPSQASSCVQDGPDCTCVISSTRMPSMAFFMEFCDPVLFVHRLVFGTRRVRVGIEPYVDDRTRARRARALERGPDLARFANGFAVNVEHAGELLEVDVA